MLKIDKYLSVISNFGCHYSCPYCIVKNNNLQIPKSTLLGLNKLKIEIENNHCNWVSISGGGDPLWEYNQHIDWYDCFFNIIKSIGNIKTELHTSMINVPRVSEAKLMTLYIVLKHYDNNDNLYYDVSPFNLIGTISYYFKYHALKDLFLFFKMSRLSERQAKKLAEKMNGGRGAMWRTEKMEEFRQ